MDSNSEELMSIKSPSKSLLLAVAFVAAAPYAGAQDDTWEEARKALITVLTGGPSSELKDQQKVLGKDWGRLAGLLAKLRGRAQDLGRMEVAGEVHG